MTIANKGDVMKIKKIERVGKKEVYDISVENVEHYVLENGVITHNTGQYYSADNIYIVGRQQDKDGKEVVGYDFIINIEKSRFVKEKSKIPISVNYEDGIKKYSGLMDIALESGHVDKPSKGWYCSINKETGECGKNYRLDDTENAEFWEPILNDPSFQEYVMRKFMLVYSNKDQIMCGEPVTDEGEC